MDRWTACMLTGDFAAAWEFRDAVLRTRAGRSSRDLERHEQWVWDGTPLDGKRVLVRCYHELGDTIQFVRYAPLIAAIAEQTAWWVQPQLIPLLETVRGVGQLEPLHDGVPDVDYDIDIESMELAHAFRTTIDMVPACVPYLHVAPLLLRMRAEPHVRLEVAIAWRSGSWDPRCSLPTEALAPLGEIPGVRFHVLHHNGDASGLPANFVVTRHENTVLGAARLIKAVDLVISVDSLPAHLAGALGMPVWTLLQSDADWRWLARGETSPWYPTMRLFRQGSAGDWHEVVEQVEAALCQLAA